VLLSRLFFYKKILRFELACDLIWDLPIPASLCWLLLDLRRQDSDVVDRQSAGDTAATDILRRRRKRPAAPSSDHHHTQQHISPSPSLDDDDEEDYMGDTEFGGLRQASPDGSRQDDAASPSQTEIKIQRPLGLLAQHGITTKTSGSLQQARSAAGLPPYKLDRPPSDIQVNHVDQSVN